jgi:hypothetical protein
MPWVDRLLIALAMLALAAGAIAAPANPPAYGKVDTFEPGKKYSCVPSADHKSWDCTQTGKATNDETAPPPRDTPVAAARVNPQPTAAVAPPPRSVPAATTPRSSELPNYLKASAARPPVASPGPVAAPPPVAVPAAVAREPAPVATPRPVVAPVVQAPANPRRTPAVAVQPRVPKSARPGSKPTAAAADRVVTAPVAAPAPARASTLPRATATGANGGFLDLPGDHFVIELAHGEREADVAAARASLHLPRGEVYELHLRQKGGDAWLLVWGSFDDVGAARAARAELPADVHVGWPRRVAPLQAEVRRVQG